MIVLKRNKYEEQLRRIMNALAASVQGAADEELIDEARRGQQDQLAQGAEVRAVLRSALRDFSERKLREARRQYEALSTKLQKNEYHLPATAAERRTLLVLVLDQRPDIGSVVFTAHHRDFSELSDEDVESFLRQLKELGLLDAQVQPSGE